MRLKDRVAIVTGGAMGIGRAYTQRFCSEGAAVLIADVADEESRKLKARLEGEGAKVEALHVDVSSERDTQRMAETALEHFGRIDALICNAGIFPRGSLEEITLEAWNRVMAVNLTGTFLCCKAVVPTMKAQGRGSLITVATGAYYRTTPNLSHYIASKGGVIGLTRALAAELGPFGITVNCIVPTLTKTEGTLAVGDETMFERRVDQQFIKRQCEPEDLAGAAVYLCSDDGTFVTGQCHGIFGGVAYI